MPEKKSMLGRLGRSRGSREEIPVAPPAPDEAAAKPDQATEEKTITASVSTTLPAAPGAGSSDPRAEGPGGAGANENAVAAAPSASATPGDRIASLERELSALRAQSAQALAAAEQQLGAAVRRIDEVDQLRRQSLPPPPTELNEARTRAAKIQVELSELRADRDEHKRQLESARADLDSSRAQLSALTAALTARDARLGLLESSVQASLEKARSESARAEENETQRRGLSEGLEQLNRQASELRDARDLAQASLRDAEEKWTRDAGLMKSELTATKSELEVTKAALDAARSDLASARGELRSSADTGSGLRGELDSRDQQIASLRREISELQASHAKSRGELSLEQSGAREREARLVAEVREREAKMIAEVQSREAKLIELAQSREKQLVAEAESALQAAARERQSLTEKVAAQQKALDQAREREVMLDAEARLKSNSMADDLSEREAQLEEQLENARRDARLGRDAIEELREAKQRAETRVGELQATVDSLGLERAALRAEAGQVRAQLELSASVEKRAHQMMQELEELRGENEFLNAEVARYASAEGKPAPKPQPQ